MARCDSFFLLSVMAIAPLSLGCLQILGDYTVATESDGATVASTGAGPTSGAGGASPSGSPSSGAAGSTSTSGSGGAAPAPCAMGSISEIQDDFDDNTTGPQWKSYTDDSSHITASERNKQLEITTDGFAPTDGSGGPFAGYRSRDGLRPFAGCTMTVEVKSTQTTFKDIAVRMELVNDSDPDQPRLLRISQVGPQIVFHNYSDGDTSAMDVNSSIMYNAADHRWWRFRETDGTTYMETAPDGKQWIERLSFPTPSFVNQVRINLTMGTKTSSEPGGTVIFDNLNLPPP